MFAANTQMSKECATVFCITANMAINRAVVQMDTTMFAKITANLFRTEFLLD